MARYKRGDRVKIVRGSYATNRYGTFLAYYGTFMAQVRVDADNRGYRNLMLTSITTVVSTDGESESTAGATVTVDRSEVLAIQDEIDNLQERLGKLQLRLKNILDE